MKALKVLLSIIFWGVLTAPVFAQSQDDINPNFNASSDDMAYVLLNYDCSNVAHFYEDPENNKVLINIYRKLVPSGDSFKLNTYAVFGDRTHKELYDTVFLNFVREIERGNPTPSSAILLDEPQLHPYTGEVICYKPNGEDIPYTDEDGEVIQNALKENVAAQLIPPTVQAIENYFLEGIYLFWAFIGTYSAFSLGTIWFKYQMSINNKVRNEEVFTQFVYWVGGLILAIVGIPALNFVYEIFDIRTTECFYYESEEGEEPVYDLTVPGFTFFFKDVCTGNFAIQNQ